ncbi:MAG: hypothetical protein H7Y17_13505, partial [Chlorobia bacterium]|nr:hypothetical protein [Fimbriimonadaceae bacterium]
PFQMALEEAGVYEKIFIKQKGEEDTIAPPAPVQAPKRVTVTITRVENVDDGIDLVGPADFFAEVTIGGTVTNTPIKLNDNKHSPNWSVSKDVDANTVSITIRLIDDDSPTTADDLCDLNPATDKKSLFLTYNLRTGQITGSVAGSKGQEITATGRGDSDKCMIRFKINHT